jgi:arylsulfatase A-like enzyme
MNVVLIVVDSLRSDHLGINGYDRDTSPNIDKLAKEGVFFTNAICTIPRTSPSVSSILTGLYPHSHGLRFLFTYKLNPNVATLQEILQTHGYKTIGNDIEMNDTGIERGFDAFNLLRWRIINKIKRTIKKTVNWNYKVDPAKTLTDFAIKSIKKLRNEKFFLYLHYIGLHWPYNPPKPYDEMFESDYKGKHTFNEVNGKISRGDLIFNNNLPKEEIKHAIAHHDGSIRHVDFQIGRLLKHLENLNLMDDTLVILTADHGECFGEHNLYFQHGEYLYDEGLKVPLVIKHPKLLKKKIEKQVQLTDIMPTVLEILNIPSIDKIDGISLMPMIEEDKVVREYTFAESGKNFFKQNKRVYFEGIKGKWRMIRTDEWKLIYIPHPDKDIYELYNLKNDFGETKNLIDKEIKIADKLKKELFKWMEGSQEDEGMDLTEKSKKLLRKLGYME